MFAEIFAPFFLKVKLPQDKLVWIGYILVRYVEFIEIREETLVGFLKFVRASLFD